VVDDDLAAAAHVEGIGHEEETPSRAHVPTCSTFISE
jgi:hypothetical protein